MPAHVARRPATVDFRFQSLPIIQSMWGVCIRIVIIDTLYSGTRILRAAKATISIEDLDSMPYDLECLLWLGDCGVTTSFLAA